MTFGKVTKLNAWKNKNGYFVGIGAIDYMYYGTPDVKIGDEVVFETGKPSPDGKPTLKSIRKASVEMYVDGNPNLDRGQLKHEIAPLSKDDTITRLACIKAACELLSGRDVPNRADEAIAVARRLEKYAKEG